VSRATRDRVLAAVDKLGYQPNASARSLVSRRTMTVGLVTPVPLHGDVVYLEGHELYAGNYGELIVGIGDHLNTHGYRLLCLVTRDPSADDVRALVRGGQVDGMLFLQVQVKDPRIAAMRAEGLPFVSIGRPRDAAGIVRADADFARSGELAVRHLISLGHRRIGFLTTGQGNVPLLGFQWHALAGFRRAHREAGLPLDRNQVLYHENEDELSLRAALTPFLQGRQEMTALIATHGIEAALAQQILLAHGHRIPDDLSLICVNYSGLTKFTHPPITVVRFSPADLILTAVDLLVGMLDGRQPSRLEHLVPVELVTRGSTGPAPNRS
jgi:DNA-binding LacI/PurR family transcriptional regulator